MNTFMRRTIAAAVMAAAIVSPALADHGHGDEQPAAKMQHTDHCGLPMGEGTVTALDVKTSKARIDHGPIAELDWDAMTMDFKASKGVDLAAFAAGDRVHFLLTEDAKSKSYRIEAMCSLDAPEGLHDACMGKMHQSAMSAAEASGKPCAMEGMDHRTMPGMDHGNMEGMDHSSMDHDADANAPASPGPEMETPPPPEAGSGPPRAADAIWGADAMRASRADLQKTHGDYNLFWFQADRAELQMRDGADGYLWDLQGFYGGTTHKFWFKSEGEGTFGEKPESAEIQGLWSHAIGPWWDLQAGVRQDLTGPERTHAVLGVQGLAPYMFEVDAAAFLSTKGDLTARVEAELDQRITQRLILQPRAEVNFAAKDDAAIGLGSGLSDAELGLRLRYEFQREFAPYIGVSWERKFGDTADYARADGENAETTSFVIGLRAWY